VPDRTRTQRSSSSSEPRRAVNRGATWRVPLA
jgi:hypothetical protein